MHTDPNPNPIRRGVVPTFHSRLPRTWFRSRCRMLAYALTLLIAGLSATTATACPFCSAVARTFTEQIASSDVVVIASLQTEPSSPDEATLPRANFKIVDMLKGSELAATGDEFAAIVVNRNHKIGDQFLLMGSGADEINWTTPMKASERVIDYLKKLDSLPEKGADRLAFFASHFEDEETVLAYDAYDEFARAPYGDVKQLKDRLDRDQLVAWIQDPDVMKSRKRLYYTLLGVCGTEKEVQLLEDILKSGDRERQAGLDALIACYLTLCGDEGVELVESLFLKNPNAEYIDVFSAIQALRFHGTEADRVSNDRIVGALRHVLDRPKMADMVIPDLARWEDWSVMERLVTMFKEATTDETSWVRTPIISYLQACPKPEAKTYIVELREIDPDAVRRAEMLAELNWDDEDEEEEADDGDVKADQDKGQSDDQESGSKGVEKKEGKGKGDSDSNEVANHVTARQTTELSIPDAQKVNSQASSQPATASGRIVVAKPVALPGDDSALPNRDGSTRGTASNPSRNLYVSTDSGSTSSSSPGIAGQGRDREMPTVGPDTNTRLAQSSQSTVPVAAASSPSSVVAVLLVISLICVILFVLLWSVLNGWFERLIF